jgi:TolB protein
VFYSDRDGDDEIWVAHSDGADPRRVTEGTGRASAPAWSPDGNRFAYVRSLDEPGDADARSDVWIANADGSDPRQVTDGITVEGIPAWSPDGLRLLFQALPDGARELHVLDLESGELRRLHATVDGDRWRALP